MLLIVSAIKPPVTSFVPHIRQAAEKLSTTFTEKLTAVRCADYSAIGYKVWSGLKLTGGELFRFGTKFISEEKSRYEKAQRQGVCTFEVTDLE